MKNPFNPQFGRIPPFFIGRKELVETIVEAMKDQNSPYRTTLISGVRGSGKTVLITDVGKEVEKLYDWIVINVPMNENLLVNALGLLYDRSTPTIKKIFDSFSGINFSAFGFSVGFTDNKQEFSTHVVFSKMLEVLKKNGISVLITIDEINSNKQLKEFASMYQVWLREEYDVAVIMTGLPHQISELQNDDVLTFLLRSKRILLEPIELTDIYGAYTRSFATREVSFSEDAIALATKTTKGYAYVFQLIGYYLWESRIGQEIRKEDVLWILPNVQEDLFRNVLSKITSELSEVDLQFLEAMSENEIPVKMQSIGEKMGKDNNYLTNYRNRLIENGIVFSPKYGYLDFTLPFMKEYFEFRRKFAM